MRQAREAGARVVHFPEGATCAPHKRVMSASGPDEVGPAEWSRCRWDVLSDELRAASALAHDLELWVVLGAVSNAGSFAREAQGHAAANSYWISYSTTTGDAARGPSGVVDPDGEWAALCSPTGDDQLAIADLELEEGLARPWRRSVRAGIYEPHVRHDDPRSLDRTSF